VAAIFPEHFQSFTVLLKKKYFLLFFLRKTISAFCQNRNKNKQSHSGEDESTGRRRSRGSLRTLRRTYHDGDLELLEEHCCGGVGGGGLVFQLA
jgi:hypothetical protein